MFVEFNAGRAHMLSLTQPPARSFRIWTEGVVHAAIHNVV